MGTTYIVFLIIHVLSVVIWIGGVSFVTMITFPMIHRVVLALSYSAIVAGILTAHY